VVILGGGPAGSSAATLLAARGHDVGLLHLNRPPAAALAESIPPSARRILDELGLLATLDGAGFHANRGNVAWWAGAPARREDFTGDQPGFHTDRGALEEILVTAARAAGAHVHGGCRVRSGEHGPDGWTLRVEAPDGPSVLEAEWVIDATGRIGVLARAERRQPDRSTTTLALVRRWRRPGGWPDVDAHHTLVESYADGWAWSVPLDDEVRCFTAMIDQRHTDLDGVDVDAMLEHELARTSHVGPGREGAEPMGGAWACPASLYTASSFARPGLLLAGDAGSFIDPLSSFGVKKALSSGWLAGVTAHTSLVDPGMAERAVGLFDEREREVYRSYRAMSAPFFETAAEHHGTAYWTRRAEAARRAGGPDRPAPHADADRVEDSVPEAEVRRAFETIRARPTLAAVRGRTLRSVERPGIDGHRIVMREHLVSDARQRGMRYVRGVDLLALVDVAPGHADVPDGWAAYNGRAAPVTLPDYLTALATAFAAGFLEHGDA
jgi:FAD-dependent halogenase